MDPTVVFETVHGSTAFNLARAGSDVDVKGVVVGPRSWYLSFVPAPELVEVSGQDHVRFEVRKFLRLALDANPQTLEMLFADPRWFRTVTPAGRVLLDARDLFVTRKVADTFAGYALGQLRRIRTHRGWLLDPPAAAPSRAEFGLPESSLVPADQLAAALVLVDEGGPLDVSSNFLDVLARERRYRSAKQRWENYQGWLRARNPARAELEARFGYDTKHAMHLVRLLRMAVEVLEQGTVIVSRPDRDELLAVRDGVWSFDRLEGWATEEATRVRELAARSSLPPAADVAAVEEVCMEVVSSCL